MQHPKRLSLRVRAGRTVAVTSGILLALYCAASLLSYQTYAYFAPKPSPIPGGWSLSVRRGHPYLQLPVVGREAIDTGIQEGSIDPRAWASVHDGSLSTVQFPGGTPYAPWATHVGGLLNQEFDLFSRARWSWYLEQHEAIPLVIEVMREPQNSAQKIAAQSLGLMLDSSPELAAPISDALLKLLADPDRPTRPWTHRLRAK